MKSLLLYTGIYSYTAEMFVEKMKQVDNDEDLEILINSPGGSVFAGWSIIGPLNERKGKNIAKVYGDASSMAFYMLLFMDEVYAIDASTFLVHRADGYVSNDEERKFLSDINKTLRIKMEKRIDAKLFEEATGTTFDELFAEDKRKDVFLSAKQAKKIGLIKDIIRIEPRQLKAMSERFVALADFESQGSEENPQGSEAHKQEINNNQKLEKMTYQELKSNHPDIFNAIHAEGVKVGVEQGKADEKDRIQAFLEFIDIDAATVTAAINEGKEMTRQFMAEMTRKSLSPDALKAAKNDSPSDQKLEGDELDAVEGDDDEVEAYKKRVFSAAGIMEGGKK